MMIKSFEIIMLVIVFCSLASCAVSKALYLGCGDYSDRTGSLFPREWYTAENINGNFPEAVYIKTKTQSFNLYHYYILHEGRIWYKSIDEEREPREWTLFEKTGLPHARKWGFNKTKSIVEISADADELVALSAEGNFYRYCFDITIAHRSNVWLDQQGWPVEEQIYFDSRTARNRAWALGKRNGHVLYYEDIFGNQHHNGTMEVTTTYVLLEDGQEICYGDTGVPSDFSRNFIGPERGAFKAVSLSASASTMFVINDAGEMYTRLVDFDTAGCDPMWFKYTYVPYESDVPGTSFFSNLDDWGLPSEDWRPQPRIPLAGSAAITRYITILQNGHGNGARELRVAGLDEAGRAGYWTKAIFDDSWTFNAAALSFTHDAILVSGARYDSDSRGERGMSLDKRYDGYRWVNNRREDGWEYAIPQFNILEGDCALHITRQGETCVLKLHPVEMWTYVKRDYLPGRTGSPKMFMVTLEIPSGAFDSLSDDFAGQLREQYALYDRKFFHYTIAATANYIVMREADNSHALLFLTDGTISSHYSELNIDRNIESHGEVQRYYAPELIIAQGDTVTMGQLSEKIALNKKFVDELKYQIRFLKWSQFTAVKFDAGYLPVHYITKITPLRFVNVPKIRTITSFGERLVLANSAYIFTTTNSRIDLYEKILEMLETRILCYEDMRQELSGSVPPWYADDISDYWEIAALPRAVSGTFFGAGNGNKSVQIQAALAHIDSPAGQNVSGWFFAIDGSNNFSFFLESHGSAKKIYSRRGKTPQEKKVRLNGALYINDNADTQDERDIIDRCLRPYALNADKAIKVIITFDGKTFEITEYSPRRRNHLIFRGVL